jgi:hypothetical protein
MVVTNVKIYDNAVTTGKISADTIVAADIAAQGVGGAEVSTAALMLMGRDNSAHTSSTAILFGTSMTTVPYVFLQVVGNGSGTTASVVSTGTASFNYLASIACTLDWLAVANISGMLNTSTMA